MVIDIFATTTTTTTTIIIIIIIIIREAESRLSVELESYIGVPLVYHYIFTI